MGLCEVVHEVEVQAVELVEHVAVRRELGGGDGVVERPSQQGCRGPLLRRHRLGRDALQLVEAPARERRPLRGRSGAKDCSPLADERELPIEGVLLVTGEVLGACGRLRGVPQPVLGKRVGPGVE